MSVTYKNGPIFDGDVLRHGCMLRMQDGVVQDILLEDEAEGEVVDLNGDILAPGYVDLQVNGGGGLQFNASPTVETLETISRAHRQLPARAVRGRTTARRVSPCDCPQAACHADG